MQYPEIYIFCLAKKKKKLRFFLKNHIIIQIFCSSMKLISSGFKIEEHIHCACINYENKKVVKSRTTRQVLDYLDVEHTVNLYF